MPTLAHAHGKTLRGLGSTDCAFGISSLKHDSFVAASLRVPSPFRIFWIFFQVPHLLGQFAHFMPCRRVPRHAYKSPRRNASVMVILEVSSALPA